MFEVAKGDALRLTAKGVTHSTLGSITADVAGTAYIRDEDGNVVSSLPINQHTGNDWFVDIPAPVVSGPYTVSLVFSVSGAQRTISEEIFVL